MVPFESQGTVSSSHSILTMALSLAISEIFNVKEWLDLEIWVWDRSWSLKIVRFDRPCMTFFPFSSYLTLSNIVTLKSGIEVTQGH